MSLSYVHLRSFHAVATQGSFTKAAEILNITQPTLSFQVKEMEEKYGVKLFSRYSRRIELTSVGRSILAITRRMFRCEEEIERLLLSAHGLTTGELRVAADSPYIITPLLARFERHYPGIQISIQYGNSEQVMKWLTAGRCDVAIVPNVPAGDKQLDAMPLSSDQLVLFVCGEHPWAERRSVAIQDLADQRIILREPGSRTRAIFEKTLADCGVVLTERMEISSREGVCEAVAAGFGVGVVSENELSNDLRLHSLKINNADLTHSEFAICRKQKRSVRVINAFFESVAESLGSGGA